MLETGLRIQGIAAPSAARPGDALPAAPGATAPIAETLHADAVKAAEAALRTIAPELAAETSRLSIARDPASGLFIYRTVDKKSGQVISQWPAEAMLALLSQSRDLEGVLFDRRI